MPTFNPRGDIALLEHVSVWTNNISVGELERWPKAARVGVRLPAPLSAAQHHEPQQHSLAAGAFHLHLFHSKAAKPVVLEDSTDLLSQQHNCDAASASCIVRILKAPEAYMGYELERPVTSTWR